MLDFLGARSFKATCVAMRMGVFAAFEEGARTPEQLADSKVGGAMARASARFNGLALFRSRGGQAYGFDEIASWLRATGFTAPRKIDLPRSPGSSLILASVDSNGPPRGPCWGLT